jgi:DNA-binding beta-propeller fold protein YncE
MRHLVLAASFVLAACGSEPTPSVPPPPATLAPELGVNGSAAVVEVLTEALNRPRDLAFNPLRPDELWIVSNDGSVVIVHETTSNMTFEKRRDPAADHFLHKPSSIAFGADPTTFGSVGTFATCGESRNEHGIEGAEDFMGPALWSSDLEVFAVKDPIGLGSHLDMLHNSPLCMGVAHERDNVYWTTNGRDNSIIRYDFAADHNIGLDDHTDGASLEFVRGLIKYAPGIPSHMVYRAEDAMLYFADTGNGRVVKLDTASGVRGLKLPTKERQVGGHYRMNDAVLTDVVPPGVLTAPSGLEIKNDILYVSDNETGHIVAFDLQGKQLNAIETGLPPGSLAGMAFGPDGKLYFVDMVGNRLLRLDPS